MCSAENVLIKISISQIRSRILQERPRDLEESMIIIIYQEYPERKGQVREKPIGSIKAYSIRRVCELRLGFEGTATFNNFDRSAMTEFNHDVLSHPAV